MRAAQPGAPSDDTGQTMTHDTAGRARGLNGGIRWILWAGAAVLLSLPAVAMRFTDEVDWTASDFVTFGAMLAVAGIACELVAWTVRRTSLRIVAWCAIALAFLLVWAELAVGLFGPG